MDDRRLLPGTAVPRSSAMLQVEGNNRRARLSSLQKFAGKQTGQASLRIVGLQTMGPKNTKLKCRWAVLPSRSAPPPGYCLGFAGIDQLSADHVNYSLSGFRPKEFQKTPCQVPLLETHSRCSSGWRKLSSLEAQIVRLI